MKSLIFVFLISKALGASIDIASISPDSFYVQDVTNYQVAFLTQTTIPKEGKLLIKFPADFSSLPQGALSYQLHTETLSSAGATFTMNGNDLTISGLFTQAFSTGLLDFTIKSIPNPITSRTTSSFKIYTTDKDLNIIDQKESDLTVKFNSKDITTASITNESKICGAETPWVFTFITSLNIPTLGTIIVKFPYWNQHLPGSSSPYRSFINSSLTCEGLTSNI